MKSPEEIKYKQEMFSKLLELKEKAHELGFPCLFAVQVGETIHIVGDTAKGNPSLLKATHALLEEF